MVNELCVQVGFVVVVIAVLLDAALAVGAYRVWRKERHVHEECEECEVALRLERQAGFQAGYGKGYEHGWDVHG